MIVKASSTLSLLFTQHSTLATPVVAFNSATFCLCAETLASPSCRCSLADRGATLSSLSTAVDRSWGQAGEKLSTGLSPGGEKRRENGLSDQALTLGAGVISKIISAYTREAGVRFQGVSTGLVGQVSGTRGGPDRSAGRADPSPRHPTAPHIPHTCGQSCGNTSV